MPDRARRVLVVGAGPAGLTAAIAAAGAGADVTLCDGNEKPGRKLAITGKGRCNLTNACPRAAFFEAVRRNPRFLYSAFSAFTNEDVMRFFEARGVPLKVERGNRVFPRSDRAFDIVDALAREAARLGVRTHYGDAAERLLVESGRVTGAVTRRGQTLAADAVVIATGGLSYPSTGSTGDGYRFARQCGHAVSPTRGSLVGIVTNDPFTGALAGLTLKNVTLTASRGGRVFFSELGELLFTHDGVSGPLVLSMTAELDGGAADVALALDLKPALSNETLDRRILREIDAAPSRHVASLLCALLPRAMAPIAAGLARVPEQLPLSQLKKAQRADVVAVLKHFPLHMTALRPIGEAVVTRGGVDVTRVDPRTMASKCAAGLFFAGEVLDVDARTGGFNLQIAFSTGRAAGLAAAKSE